MNGGVRRRTLAALGLSFCLVTGALGVAATPQPASDVTATGNPPATAEDFPTFVSSTVAEHRGDVARVNISFEGSEVAHLHVGGPEVGMEFAATVTDDDGDGYAVVRLNTYAAGTERGALAGVASGSARNVSESASSGALPVGEYSMGLATRSQAVARDDPTSVGTLFVRPRSNLSVTLWRTGANVSAVDDAGSITDRIEDGTLGRSEVFTAGDTVVVAVDAAGIEGLLAAQSGPTTTERFRAGLETGALSLTVRQTDETTPPSYAPVELNLSRAAAVGDLRVVEGSGDTYYVAFDAASDAFQRASAGGSTPEDGQNFAVRVGITEAARVANATETATAEYRYRGAGIVLDADEYTLAPAANQTVTGRATVPPGSSVTVVVESTGSDDEFGQRRSATVRPDGTFRATFDLSTLAVGENLTVTVAGPNVENATAPAVIGRPPSFAVADVSPPETARPGAVVPVGVMVRNVGEVSGTTTVAVAVGEAPVATETVTLAGGEATVVVLDVEMPDAEPGAYELRAAAGSNATTATVDLRERTPPPTDDPPRTTRPAVSDGTATGGPSRTASAPVGGRATTADGGGSPGFTTVASVVGVFAALLALRRRN